MSRYLLDTQVWLWMQADPQRLGPEMHELLAADHEFYLSAASGWEIAIKVRLGKLTLPEPPHQYVPDRLRISGTLPLAIEHDHVLRVATLPDHHRDPFDRLLVVQAQALAVPLVTADRQLDAYDVQIMRP